MPYGAQTCASTLSHRQERACPLVLVNGLIQNPRPEQNMPERSNEAKVNQSLSFRPTPALVPCQQYINAWIGEDVRSYGVWVMLAYITQPFSPPKKNPAMRLPSLHRKTEISYGVIAQDYCFSTRCCTTLEENSAYPSIILVVVFFGKAGERSELYSL